MGNSSRYSGNWKLISTLYNLKCLIYTWESLIYNRTNAAYILKLGGSNEQTGNTEKKIYSL
jgi:hypothetical protein